MQQGAVALEEVVPRAGQPDASFDVHHVKGRTQLDMVLGLEAELSHFALSTDLDVLRVVLADRDIRIGRLGHFQQQGVELRLEGLGLLLELLFLRLQGRQIRQRGLPLGARQLRDRLAHTILLGRNLLEPGLDVFKPAVDVQQFLDVGVDPFVLGRLNIEIRIVADEFHVDHSLLPRCDKTDRTNETYRI